MSWQRMTTYCAVLAGLLGMGSCMLEDGQSRALVASLGATSGPIFITGHDPDFHAQDNAGARRLLTEAVDYVRHGSSLPFLWVESRIRTPGGHRVGKQGLTAIGLVEGTDFVHMNAAELAVKPASWWESLATRYSAVAVASDFGGLLTQDELDQLNAHRDEISGFVNSGGGVLALSEGGGGAHLTSRSRFGFLPIDVDSTGNATPPYTVTDYGRDEFGLRDSDVNSPSHCHFNSDFGLNVVSRSGPTGQIMTLAGKAHITESGFLVANAGPDQTLDATAALTPVTLDGSGSSTDPDGVPLRYVWSENGVILADTGAAAVTVELAPGVHTITLTVFNSRDESASDEVIIEIADTLPPSITCPDDVVIATEPDVCSAGATYPAPVAAGNTIISVECDPGSGDTFLGGVTPVTCTATDAQGRSASCSFTVTVVDRQPPVAEVPAAVTIEADAALCTAPVPDLIAGTDAWDNCTHEHDLAIAQYPAAGTELDEGTHTISIRVMDESGNSTSASAAVTVVDGTPPVIAGAVPSQATLWPPNHRMVPVTVAVDASDACAGAVQCAITSVMSNQPANDKGDGNTDTDWVLGGGLTVSLRAERAGPLTDRVYTLEVSCTDAAGNAAFTTTTVTVPHDQGGR